LLDARVIAHIQVRAESMPSDAFNFFGKSRQRIFVPASYG
jgi:hypothetical protein